MNCNKIALQLIVTIVRKGKAETVMDAARQAGAEGGTILNGRGTGIHEKASILGMAIEPEKEIVLILTPKAKVQRILESIGNSIEIEKPGRGLAFVIDVEKVIGICHNLD
ncbi:MAG: P-II family nitrogen regulator [Chloroflexota bacterium]|jgi:nitrogen regulatory protein PII